MKINVDWNTLKSFVDTRNLLMQYVDIDNAYYIVAQDDFFALYTVIPKVAIAADDTDQYEFEQDYQLGANQKISKNDIDYAQLVRLKICKEGWHLYCKCVQFETSKLASVVDKKYDNTDMAHTKIKFYDANGTELTTQNEIDSSCVMTQVDFEPPYNYEIKGGELWTYADITSDIFCWLVGVPDISEELGGSVVFCNNWNPRYGKYKVVDGFTPKLLYYSAQYHTNKLRIIMRHNVGIQVKFCMVFNMFRG